MDRDHESSTDRFAGYLFNPTNTFQDAGVTPGAAASPIGRATDLTGGGNHLNQTTGADKPLLVDLGSGLYCARADGTSEYLISAAGTVAQPFTIGLRYRASAASLNSLKTLFVGNASDSGSIRVSNAGADPTNVFDVYSGGFLTNTLPMSASWATLVITFDGASSEARVNGSVFTTGNAGASGLSGWLLFAWNAGGIGRYFSGDVAALEIYDNSLSTGDKELLEAYLDSKAT